MDAPEFVLPPEAILWKDTEDTTIAVRVWMRQTHPNVSVERVDSMVGPLLEVNFGAYGFKVRPGMIVMKDQGNGLYSALSLQEYTETYMS